MKNHHLVYILGFYLLIISIFSYFRSDSTVLMLSAGFFGFITIVIGRLLLLKTKLVFVVAINWIGFLALLNTSLTFLRLLYPDNRVPGSELIYGSMTLLSGLILLFLIVDKTRIDHSRHK
ncbi:MAG: hypothetical protein ABIJ12_01455 [bacterium]